MPTYAHSKTEPFESRIKSVVWGYWFRSASFIRCMNPWFDDAWSFGDGLSKSQLMRFHFATLFLPSNVCRKVFSLMRNEAFFADVLPCSHAACKHDRTLYVPTLLDFESSSLLDITEGITTAAFSLNRDASLRRIVLSAVIERWVDSPPIIWLWRRGFENPWHLFLALCCIPRNPASARVSRMFQ